MDDLVNNELYEALQDPDRLNRLVSGGLRMIGGDEDSLLHYAVQVAPLESIRTLLRDAGAAEFINDEDSLFRHTPILYAVERFDIDLIELLVQFGANINVVNPRDGSTVLSSIIERAPATFIRALVRLGADQRAGDFPQRVAVLANVRFEKNPNTENRELLEFILGKPVKPRFRKKK